MKKRLMLAAVLLAGTIFDVAGATADFYVSPEGSDAWSGALSAPDAGRADGPFALIAYTSCPRIPSCCPCDRHQWCRFRHVASRG